MCDFERYNIKVVEGNELTLLLPLKSRTFVASRPVDEDIVIEELENLRVFVNNTEYSSVRQENDGVAIDFPATLKQGDYDVVLTATYHGVNIRAAYNDAVIIVAWNQQSDAQQYVQGSPFVLPAAYVLGIMTDSELEALKAQLRLEIAAAQRAKEEAEQAKEEYIAKGEALDDVAQQTTLTQGVQDIREDISHIDIDTSNLAKQGSNAGATLTDTQAAAQDAKTAAEAAKTAAQDAKTLIGQPAIGQPSDLFAAIAAGGDGANVAKEFIVQTLNNKGYAATTSDSWGEVNNKIAQALTANIEGWEFIQEPTTYLDCMRYAKVMVIRTIQVQAHFLGYAESLVELQFTNASTFQNANSDRLKYPESVIAPNIAGQMPSSGYTFLGSPLRKLVQNYIISGLASNGKTLYSLYWFELNGIVDATRNFVNWIGTISTSNTSDSLLEKKFYDDPNEPTETFTTNRDKFLWYFRNHFMTSFADMTGQTSPTLTLNTTVYNVIANESDILEYFTNRNWTLASQS